MHIHNVRLQLIHMGKLCSAQVALVRILRHFYASAGLRLCSASIPPLDTDNGSGLQNWRHAGGIGEELGTIFIQHFLLYLHDAVHRIIVSSSLSVHRHASISTRNMLAITVAVTKE